MAMQKERMEMLKEAMEIQDGSVEDAIEFVGKCWHGNYEITDEGTCTHCGADVVEEDQELQDAMFLTDDEFWSKYGKANS